jgi:DNA-dependent RNA polymerase
MTYFYGSEPGGLTKTKGGKRVAYGMTRQVIEAGVPPNHAQEFARAVHKAIEGMVPSAKEVRDFLQELAALCAEKNIPVRWTTPLGLPVINRYHAPKIKNISVSLGDKRTGGLSLRRGDHEQFFQKVVAFRLGDVTGHHCRRGRAGTNPRAAHQPISAALQILSRRG